MQQPGTALAAPGKSSTAAESRNKPVADSDDVTRLLERWKDGDEDAFNLLLPAVYDELRRVAGRHFQKERRNHTLQPTEVLHEAYVRLAKPGASFDNRAHFFAAAAASIRQVLVDYARRRAAQKRPESGDRVTFVDPPASEDGQRIEILALHEAIERLAEVSPRQAELVELRYFGGLSREEIAEVLQVSVPTVTRDWRVARMLLRNWLDDS